MVTPQLLANALLVRTCHDLCAVVCFSEEGQLYALEVFDCEYFDVSIRISKPIQEIWLMFEHEDGGCKIDLKEQKLIKRICSLGREQRIRVFLCSEYWPCREVELEEEARMCYNQ